MMKKVILVQEKGNRLKKKKLYTIMCVAFLFEAKKLHENGEKRENRELS